MSLAKKCHQLFYIRKKDYRNHNFASRIKKINLVALVSMQHKNCFLVQDDGVIFPLTVNCAMSNSNDVAYDPV